MTINVPYIILLACFSTLSNGFVPEMQIPGYKATPGTSTTEISKLASTLTCDEQRNSLQDCATECSTTGYPGFYTDTTQSNICYLCSIRVNTDAVKYEATNDHILYILETNKAVIPIPEISMDFDDYTGDTINGVSVVGTTSGVKASDHVAGPQGLYLHDGGKIALTGSETECWTNLEHCPDGITASIWIKLESLDITMVIVGSGSYSRQRGFQILVLLTGEPRLNIYLGGKHRRTTSRSKLVLHQWYFLVGTFDQRTNESVLYLDGVEHGRSSDPYRDSAETEVRWGAHIGVEDANWNTRYPFHGFVNEFKYYYRVLNSTEIWREYISFDPDLGLSSVIPSPDLVSSSNDYTEVMDGNLATCVPLTNTMQVKLWNSANDKTNCTVTIVTENLECPDNNVDGLIIYRKPHEDMALKNEHDRMSFLGQFSMIVLESASVNNNGQNECVFRHISDDMCFYVVISVLNVPDGSSWKICDVIFD